MSLKSTKNGYLEIILGCMFSGKTSSLREIYKQYRLCDIKCLVINYKGDTRYSDVELSTHDGKTMPCSFAECLFDLEDSHDLLSYDAILINEGQFFADLVPFVQKYVNINNKKIHICGLDGDFKKQKFGSIIDLIPEADNYVKLTALCIKCKNGNRAIFTHRLVDSDAQTLIGSSEYIPVCRSCYNNLNK